MTFWRKNRRWRVTTYDERDGGREVEHGADPAEWADWMLGQMTKDYELEPGRIRQAEAHANSEIEIQILGVQDSEAERFKTLAAEVSFGISGSKAGKLAGKQLALLDLPNNPSRYVKAGLKLTKDGYLVVIVSNKAQVAVKSVRVVVGVPVRGGIREKASYHLNRKIVPGRVVQLRTDLGPMNINTARGYVALVTEARLAE